MIRITSINTKFGYRIDSIVLFLSIISVTVNILFAISNFENLYHKWFYHFCIESNNINCSKNNDVVVEKPYPYLYFLIIFMCMVGIHYMKYIVSYEITKLESEYYAIYKMISYLIFHPLTSLIMHKLVANTVTVTDDEHMVYINTSNMINPTIVISFCHSLGYITLVTMLTILADKLCNMNNDKNYLFICCMYFMTNNIVILVACSSVQQLIYFKLRYFLPINMHDIIRVINYDENIYENLDIVITFIISFIQIVLSLMNVYMQIFAKKKYE